MKNLFLSDSIISEFIKVVPITLLVDIIYIIVKIIYIKRKNIKINYKRELIYLVFICYLTGLFNLLLVPSNFWSAIWQFVFNKVLYNPFDGILTFSFNLVPTIYKVIIGEYVLGSWVKTMLLGNLLMFVPLGILLNLCFKKINNKTIFVYALLIPIIIEFIQPIVGRSFDTDDIIMNFLGIIVGYFIIFIINKLISKSKI